ncbi:uncharacterized protein LOC110441476 [Mizuhopecten yessoensis]|uniref:C-type lectin domain-containing protein n=1 Tax=Mizuhopecten yessoensis TaxID=6573 RepID=A0A210R112_MIZYE|nr:uncharacterized protein LOC110441476 [Mizuhopecten yessoensis]OWF54716.1 hypothetical protein KP79_PYT05035 [Mizuhopecten yessoensis]
MHRLTVSIVLLMSIGVSAVEESCDRHSGIQTECQVPFSTCGYTLRPLSSKFGAEVTGVDLTTVNQSCADALKQEALMYRFLLFRDQDLTWQEQIKFTNLLGAVFSETSSLRRPFHPKTPDPRIAYLSNDPLEGIPGQGVEAWHVDGNSVPAPHQFTLIYCVSATRNGPTLIVPLKEIVDMFTPEERAFLDSIRYVSGNNESITMPLIYKHPVRNYDTIVVALGLLSGQYILRQDDHDTILSKEETQRIKDLIEAKIIGSNLIYSHQYKSKDLLLLNNPSVAHIAGPGSQNPVEVAGLRLMHRSTVRGDRPPSKTSSIKYACAQFEPFASGYCLFSLKDSVFYPRYGFFDTRDAARQRCKSIDEGADLATIPNKKWNNLAKTIIERTGVPHWLNGTNPQEEDVFWGEVKSEFTNWHREQPNDHDGPEVCLIMGPFGTWLDLACEPKTQPGADPGPVITWEDGVRRKFNVYPLCGVLHKQS